MIFKHCAKVHLQNYNPKKLEDTKEFLTVLESSHQFGQLAHFQKNLFDDVLFGTSIISKKGWSSFWLTGSSVVKTNAQIDRFSILIKVQFTTCFHNNTHRIIQFPGNSSPPKKSKNELVMHAVSNLKHD